MFLKVIDEFNYDHSERLGDAFEYLLSVLGSQVDAGQFRTPRHIIDFMVEVIDPKKTETVLDPACGTAGFLISSYKHILKVNTDTKGNSKLTPDDKGCLAQNFKGYDISPDMVRLSLVNLYLHGFADPHIHEYDTLTSQDKWNEYADVILANPPFMSPKGGIKPHNRFSVQSKRSEVLFVDYMAEHLKPNGRAGIIVPEGIIFQSQTAYKQLRKMLVEEYLVAVVSLPAGVFNPYSGVKTSILVLDKSLAKKTNTIAFFKIANDGFGLGAQRREIGKNDLPQACSEIGEYLRCTRAGQSVEDLQPTLGLIVQKEKIVANGESNLSGERYRDTVVATGHYPPQALSKLLEIQSGFPFKSELFNEERGVPIIRIRDIKPNRTVTKYTGEYDPAFLVQDGALLIGMDGEFNSVIWNGGPALLNQRVSKLHSFTGCLKEYVALLIPKKLKEIEDGTYAVTVKHISVKQISAIEIPLPPLDVQKEIVAEIEGYQKVIKGGRAVIDNYCPHIPIHPDWPLVEIGTICIIVRGSSPRPQGNPKFFGGPVPRLMVADITRDGMYATPRIDSLTEEGATKSRPMKKGDVIITVSGNPGLPTILAIDACIHDGFVGLRELNKDVLSEYLYYALIALHASHGSQSVGAVFKNLTTNQIREFKISLPPLAMQQAIVGDIEAEQALVAANRELIARFEKKIKATLARVWGEGV